MLSDHQTPAEMKTPGVTRLLMQWWCRTPSGPGDIRKPDPSSALHWVHPTAQHRPVCCNRTRRVDSPT